MKITATALLNKARGEVGFVEGARNANPYGIWYGMPNQPYCAIGLSWAAYHSGGLESIGGKWAWTPAWAAWFKREGRWLDWTKPAPRGAIVFFDWDLRHSDIMHVEIASAASASGANVSTIGFNTRSALDVEGVWPRVRPRQYIVGFGLPLYAPEKAVVVVPTRTPLIVDGIWGPKTTARLQQVLRIPQTGVMSKGTFSALAVWLRQTPSTTWTPKMRTALQSRVGVKRDGIIGPITIKALQRHLNRRYP